MLRRAARRSLLSSGARPKRRLQTPPVGRGPRSSQSPSGFDPSAAVDGARTLDVSGESCERLFPGRSVTLEELARHLERRPHEMAVVIPARALPSQQAGALQDLEMLRDRRQRDRKRLRELAY